MQNITTVVSSNIKFGGGGGVKKPSSFGLGFGTIFCLGEIFVHF